MNYLDAAIGFTVVMATFAGAATAITEVYKRLLRTKAHNLLAVLNALQTRMQEYKGVTLSAGQRYKLLRDIVNNPLNPGQGLAEHEQPVEALLKGLPPRHIFNKVSTEHVCRRSAEAMLAAGMPAEDIEKALARVARDFDMLVSSVSTQFQNRFRLFSIGTGLVIALAFNINAYRILDTFIQSPDLAREVAAQMDQRESEILEQATAEGTDVSQEIEKLQTTVDNFASKELPIGFGYGPHCTFTSSCINNAQDYTAYNWAADILVLMLTGALLGLGAPFWFDVAKRLATVRSWFGGTPSAAEAKSGREPGKSSADRKALAKDIMADLLD